ncbi:tetratricopeptide repeat protein [Cryptosporangium aurantiacum]|uniref:Tetratricopeptide repeat-containing protein n=1 Tax=Cryptosporangium aurantiacum TaxID=134849 RepID=A0A1M7N805_9ACTN|nr:tetratricopeptide repeat protein [Cryptosporangium aurantiacum]SHM99726.1 Tetratricopeptide repeat-containing protein [Cryptosporangium aurantiacum]
MTDYLNRGISTPSVDLGPYLGSRPFNTDDHDRFFGRAEEAEALRRRWIGNRLVVLHGASGIGKTSLLRAGVIPLFGVGRPHRPAVVLPVGRISLGSGRLPNGNPYQRALLSSWSPNTPSEQLAGRTIVGFLRRRREEAGAGLPLLAPVDQFEELFVDVPDRGQCHAEFLGELAEAVASVSDVHLLLAVREEALDDLEPYLPALGGGPDSHFPLEPLDSEAALEAVTKPVERTTRSYAAGVAEQLVAELRSGGRDAIEPLHLQLACTALWRALPESARTITLGVRNAHGDVGVSLGDFCVSAVEEVSAESGIPESELWQWLAQAFVTDLGTRGTVYEGTPETAGVPVAVAREFERRHILVVDYRAGSRWYWLSHDRLVAPILAMAGLTPSQGLGAAQRQLRAAEGALAAGDPELAAHRAVEAIRLSADGDVRLRADATSLLADIAVRQGRTGEAERRYGEAAGLFATMEDLTAVGRLLAATGSLHLRCGRFVDAIADLQVAARVSPGSPELKVDLADALCGAGQPQAAHGVLTDVLTVEPGAVDALLGRARTLLLLGQPDAALDDLDSAVRISPDLARRTDVLDMRDQALATVTAIGEPAA